MILYHFCAKRHLKSILREGLTVGAIAVPTDTGFYMKTGFQWLTKDGDPDRQSWATKKIINYSRTDYRLTLKIPDEEIGTKILTGEQLMKEWPETVHLFQSWPGSENWMIYKGTIPRSWIIHVEKMEAQGERTVNRDVS